MILKFFYQREFRKFPLFFALVTFTILLGSLGLVGISVVTQEVKGKLDARALELLTSDFAVTARRDLFPEEKKALNQVLRGKEFRHYRVIDVYSMATHLRSGQARLVEVRGIEDGFPFHGDVLLKTGKLKPDGLKLSQDLVKLWDIQVGDELQIGEIKLKANDVVTEDSSLGLRGFSLAPRIYVPLVDLERSGLLKPGVTGSFAYHYLLPELNPVDIKALKTAVFQELTDPAIKIVLPENSSEQTGRVIETLSNFMSLSALIGLILSLVGVFYLYQSHLLSRLRDLCLLNLHGLSKLSIVTGVVGQFTFLFAFVALLQVLILLPLSSIILPLLSEGLGIELRGPLKPWIVLQELPFLYILSLSILVPLLRGLMRTPMGLMLKAPKVSLGRFYFYDFLPFVVILWGFSCYLSNSLKIGNIFFFCLLTVFLISTLIVGLMQLGLKKLIQNRGLLMPNIESGIALRNLTRSGHKLTLSFLSLAMGATLISLILQLDRMIQNEFVMDGSKPGLFIFDIQEDQVEDLKKFSHDLGAPIEALTPMIRSRLEKVNGKKFVRQKNNVTFRGEDDQESRGRNTGLNITYRGQLSSSEKIVEGDPIPLGLPQDGRPALVSLEKRWAQRMGLSIGDLMTFDIQGVEIEAKVHNIREVRWTSFHPNFFVSMEPGFLDEAPKTYLGILPAGYEDKKLSFQQQAVNKFPNISFINVEELVAKLAQLFERSRQAIEIISMLSLGVGFVILYGLSHDQVYRRYYDLALMKTLGLSGSKLRLNLLLEFGFLFATATGLGLFLGWLIAQLIGTEVFKLSFSVDWFRVFLPGLSLSILCLGTVLISSWRAVRAKPRELLGDI